MLRCANNLPLFNKKTDAPEHVLRDYSLEMEDTFSSGQLDPAKWNTSFVWGPDETINNEEQYYVDVLGGDTTNPSPFIFNAAGNLEIQGAPITGTKPVTQYGVVGGQNYTSGLITTRDSLSFNEGYVEVCAKLPPEGTDGAWPATWLLNTFYYQNAFLKNQSELGGVGNDKFNPEMDFMEAVYGPGYQGSGCLKHAYHYHTGDRADPSNYKRWSLDGSNFKEFNAVDGSFISQFNTYESCDGSFQYTMPDTCSADYSQDFHTYGVDWRRDYIHVYVDGVIVNCINTADIVSDQAMYVLINLAIGGAFPFGPADGPNFRRADPSAYPASFEIESVRVYLP